VDVVRLICSRQPASPTDRRGYCHQCGDDIYISERALRGFSTLSEDRIRDAVVLCPECALKVARKTLPA
jgi:hypothetical protein